ncbi:MAG: hypothetical protein ACTHN3_08975 [Solirubrobacterales bacterium]
MWRWHEHMWGHGWVWMHGGSGTGFEHHRAMMEGSGHGWWLPGEALMAVLVAAVVVGIVLVARRQSAAPHPH